MKKLIGKALTIFFTVVLAVSCNKTLLSDFCQTNEQTALDSIPVHPIYSTLDEFRDGMTKVAAELLSKEVVAYLDTLENGYPDPNGRKEPLSEFVYSILEKLGGNDQQIASGVNDVFHFDGSTFSLISYIMKAQMVNDISVETLNEIIDSIPLPPIPMDGFTPPVQPVAPDTPVVNCCDHCNPSMKILTTSVYVAPCGNYSTTASGYVVKNTLTHISRNRHYRFDGEISGCNCPGGKWSNTVEIPGVGSFSTSTSSISFQTFAGGDYTITLSYTVCGKTVSKTFALSVD